MASQTPSSPPTSVATSRPEPALAPPRPPGTVAGSRALQRAGGLSALVTVGTYLVGLVVLGAYLAPRGYLEAQADPAASLQFLIGHQAVLYGWHLVLYPVGGVALMSVVLALHARLRAWAPALATTGAVFGLLWGGLLIASGMVHLVGQQAVVALAASDPESASTVWASVRVVRDALGGGVELVGAVWVFLVGMALVRSRVLWLGALGVAAGVAGAWTLVPPALDAAAVVFGVAMIVWFVGAGVSLLRCAARR